MTITRRATKPASPKRQSFSYKPRTAEQMQRRASQRGNSSEGFFHPDIKYFSPSAGDNRIRILPPTWDGADHFGFEVYVHYGIGTDNSAYLCLDKMRGEIGTCPVCAERAKAERDGEKDYADSLRISKRVAVYVIDRHRENEGVLLWNMPYTIDRDVCARAVDRDTGEVFQLDDPDAGYDIMFRRDGQGQTTKYVGVEIARRASPLSDDPKQHESWIDYAIGHPIPNMLVFHEAAHIKKIFSGMAPATEDEEVGGESAPAAGAAPSAAAAPARGALGRGASKSSAPTRHAVLAMSEEEVLELCDKEGITEEQLGDATNAPLDEFKAAVCEALGLTEEEPVPEQAPQASESLADRISRLRSKK